MLIEKERKKYYYVYVQYNCTCYLSQCIFKYSVVVNNKNLLIVAVFIEITVGTRSNWCCFDPRFGSGDVIVNVFSYVSDTFFVSWSWDILHILFMSVFILIILLFCFY